MKMKAMMFVVFLISSVVQYSAGVIYHLSEHEYARMPPLFQLAPYEECLGREGARYCSLTLQLLADPAPDDLFTMIQEYSEHAITHFNHTILQHGVCVTQTCKKYIESNPQEQRWALEACMNESLHEDYGLKARVIDKISCITRDDEVNIDSADIAVAVILALLLVVNVVGTISEIYAKNAKFGVRLVSCFSIRRNWRRLVADPGGPEPRLTRLKGINGLKAITMFMVIGLHSMIPFLVNSDNPRYMEELYTSPPFLLMINGTPVVQTFFVIGGFLLTYNLKIYEEKHVIRWTMITKGILNRWLRLTPPYAVVLAVIATWLRHAGTGPIWDVMVVNESEHCRLYWWQHLIHINNYIDYSKCMPQMWYVACDFQLYTVGLITCVLLAGGKRRVALVALLAGSMLATAAHTYWQDLDGALILSPEPARNFYYTDPTFTHIYKRAHTNAAGYVIGLGLGLLLYHFQSTKHQIPKTLKIRLLYWLAFPTMCAVVYCGSVFYWDGARAPVFARVAYAVLAKPVFSVLVAFTIVGMVVKLEGCYRGILEWRGWTTMGRLTYCAYAAHIMIVRSVGGAKTTLVHQSLMTMAVQILTTNLLSFMVAVPLYMMVEAPFSQVLKAFEPPKRSKKRRELSEEKMLNGYTKGKRVEKNTS